MRLDVMLDAGYRVRLSDGREVLVRAARSGDEQSIQAFVGGLSLMSRHQRFFLSLRELPSAMLDHLLRPDPGAEAALLALSADDDGSDDVVGLVQYGGASDGRRAEVAVVVADAWRRSGLATRLLSDLAQVAACAGLTHIEADILRDNFAAIKLASKLGASPGISPNGGALVRVSRSLTIPAKPSFPTGNQPVGFSAPSGC